MTNPSTPIVLFGGDGGEHRVSVASGQNIARYVANARAWYAAPDWKITEVPLAELINAQSPITKGFTPEHILDQWSSLEAALSESSAQAKVLILALHGGHGENGDVQAILSSAHVPFT